MSGTSQQDAPAAKHPYCEFGETLRGETCRLPGMARFCGTLLCAKHAGYLAAQERVDLLTGIVSSLDLTLRNIPLRNDANLTQHLRAEKARSETELETAIEALRRAME